MSEPNKSPISKREYWKEIIEEWRSSGLRQKKFCDAKGLSLFSFQYWRRKLGQSNISPKRGFVSVSRSTPETRREGVRVRLPSGIEFYFGGDFSEVVALLEWYEGRTC